MSERVWTVDDFLRTAPETQRAVLNQLRTFCRVLLPGYEERLYLGVPTYFRYGSAAVAFTSDRDGVRLCVLERRLAQQCVSELDGSGCLRYARPEDVDFHRIERVLQAVADPFGFS